MGQGNLLLYEEIFFFNVSVLLMHQSDVFSFSSCCIQAKFWI